EAERAELQTIFNMPLRNYIIWTYCDMSGDLKKWWQGPEFTEQGSKEEYRQIYELTVYLLTHFNNSGKHFYLGVWESDYHLLGFALNPKEPTQLRINGFIEWMNVRQKAIEDARRTVPHENVEVYGYAEVVRYFDALEGKSRVVNSVLPHIRVDLVSYSSYESTGDQTFNWGEDVRLATREAFDYIAKHSPPSEVPGCRVFVGEYGYP
ncbi:MAG: hypothetical protein WCI84_08645, partial [Bacteroidota bacterium]